MPVLGPPAIPPAFPALSDSYCVFFTKCTDTGSVYELLKFVSKLELPFYEEVAGLREEKSALVGQGH